MCGLLSTHFFYCNGLARDKTKSDQIIHISGLPLPPDPQGSQGDHHHGERRDVRRLPGLLRDSQAPVLRGGILVT